MRKPISDIRVIQRSFALCLVIMMLLLACATTDPQSLTKFKQGLSVVQTNSQTIIIEFNRFVRELQLDRAATLPNLKESDVALVLMKNQSADGTRQSRLYHFTRHRLKLLPPRRELLK
jgi:hypothetical protein